MTNGNEAQFYSPDDIPCPHLATWHYLPNGLDDLSTAIVADDIKFSGLTPPQANAATPDVDPRCCGGTNIAMAIYNANTHVCCTDGSVDTIGTCPT